MKEIELSKQGAKNKGKYVALVDDEDFEWLNKFRWCFDGRYVQRRTNEEGHIRMHFLIMKPPEGMGVDHRNGNGLDNQKDNLRICSQGNNSKNMSRHKDGSSRFKGLSRAGNKWEVRIHHNYESVRIGVFADEIEAAKAYDNKAKELHGEFAKLNFPE